MYGAYLGRSSGEVQVLGDTSIQCGIRFVDLFPLLFPDLRARGVACGHFIPEEAPGYTTEVLLGFLRGEL